MRTLENIERAFRLMAVACVLLAGSAYGADAKAPGKDGLVRFEMFLDEHPEIEARLRENPAVIGNSAFLKNHPQFATFLARQPAVRNELASDPRWFIHRELVKQSATPVTREQLAEFDRLLDRNPELARKLAQQPQLLREAETLKAQPELRNFIKQHPALDRAALRAAAKEPRSADRGGRPNGKP